MVVSGDTGGGGEGLRGLLIEPERPKLSVHRFNLIPCFKWGNQKQLRCVRVSDSTGDNNPIINGASADRIKRSRSPATEIVAAPDYEAHRCKKLKLANESSGPEEEIEAVREKVTVVGDEIDEKREDEEFKSPPLSQSTEVPAKTWNLRKRKLPVGGYSRNGKGLRIEEGGVSNSSQLRSENTKSAQVRQRFSVALSKKEIEDDLLTMLGHKAPRRVKKRPRNVQKQLDILCPGLGLTKVTLDRYKVREEKGKK